MITPAVAPHAIYTNSAETLKAARGLANKYGVPYLIHVSETRKEQNDSAAQNRMSPTMYLDSLGALEGRTVMAHMVWADGGDLAVSKTRDAGIVHCPSSNMKLASGVANVTAMVRDGLRVGLGTDGPAGSNNDCSLFEEMDLAAKLEPEFWKISVEADAASSKRMIEGGMEMIVVPAPMLKKCRSRSAASGV